MRLPGYSPVGYPPVDSPHLITNYMAYNHMENRFQQSDEDWVGDLMIEAEVEVQDSKGQFVLQLKGVVVAEGTLQPGNRQMYRDCYSRMANQFS